MNNRKVCVIDSGYDTTHQDLPSAETGGEVTGAEGVNAYAWDQDSDGHGESKRGLFYETKNMKVISHICFSL